MMQANGSGTSVAVVYLARGTDVDHPVLVQRFVESYRQHRAGIDHTLYVIFKGYQNENALAVAKEIFNGVRYEPVFLDDNSLDIGAYIECSTQIREAVMCPLNTGSEVLCDDWLLKLLSNLELPNVGLVGATASFESHHALSETFPLFPNIHIRSTGFMIRVDAFRRITQDRKIRNKIDAYHFESGPKSMTRQVLESGQRILLVGRNGRGYSPKWWPTSETFRQGSQGNLLIADNRTLEFSGLPWSGKCAVVVNTWGIYIEGKKMLPEKYAS